MASENTPSDGYYDDDIDSNEELDLSFLDEDEDK
jgi:hypothetical protein